MKFCSIHTIVRLSLCLVFAAVLSGCASSSQASKDTVSSKLKLTWERNKHSWTLVDKPVNVIAPDTIYELAPEQEAAFLAYFNDESRKDIDPHVRLADYLSVWMDGFSVQGTTQNAKDTIDSMSGNCVSLAVMASALSRVAGIRYIHRKVNRAPIYNRTGNIEFSSQHIRTVIFKPRETPEESTKYIYIDYYRADTDIPAEAVTQKEFNALYFANLAAEHIVKDDLESAYQYSSNVLLQDPYNPESINLHAVVLKLMGYKDKAEKLFEYGYKYLPTSINLYANYSQMLRSNNKVELADNVDARISEFKSSNPYDWITLGYEEYDDENYLAAIRYFEKAQRYAPYLDDVYLALAKANYKLGYNGAAKRFLQMAMHAPVKANSVKLFEAKLMQLSTLQGKTPS